MMMGDGTWTRTELRERAAFVLGVTPDASTTEAFDQYRSQLAMHGGRDERSRTARRTLAAAWALWGDTAPTPPSSDPADSLHARPDRGDLLEQARAARDRRLSEGRAVIAGDTVEPFAADDVDALLGEVEVVEVVRDRVPHWRTSLPAPRGATAASGWHVYAAARPDHDEVIDLGDTDLLV